MRDDALLGRKVDGRFTIKRLLGEGGMAKVYVAEQEDEPKQVALKVMNVELTHDRTFVRRFQREAQAAARVKHPSSVKIFAYGVEGDVSYIAMELLAGDDLYALLEHGGALSQKRAARILVEVTDALAVAHEIGIVHRDLKPENIMLVKDATHAEGERTKVLDFGIAKLIAADAIAEENKADAEPNSAVTRAGTFIGTPSYMSPEQCALQAVDTRADIYTCGVLLYQLVSARLPFEGETPLHTATLHIHQAPPRPSEHAPAIDPGLEEIILKALSKKPADRYQTAGHLGAALRKVLPTLKDLVVAREPLSTRSLRSLRSESLSLEGARSASQSVMASMFSEARDAPMESARTIVAEGLPGPPPAVRLNPDSSPGSRRAAPSASREQEESSEVSSDLSATLVRAPPEKPRVPPAPGSDPGSERRYGPLRTEVMGAPKSGRVFPEKTMESPAFGRLPSAPRSLSTERVAVDDSAKTRERPAIDVEPFDALDVAKTASPAFRRAGLAGVVQTIPLAVAREQISPALLPRAPPSPPSNVADTAPMLPALRRSPKMSGSGGVVIGFVAGLILMGIFAGIYFALNR